ncbi:LOW QUALITY PROTEIN: hypothetical protein V1477_002445, partial [Vespula maculifrons]
GEVDIGTNSIPINLRRRFHKYLEDMYVSEKGASWSAKRPEQVGYKPMDIFVLLPSTHPSHQPPYSSSGLPLLFQHLLVSDYLNHSKHATRQHYSSTLTLLFGHDKRSPMVEFVLLFEIRKARTVVLNSGVCSCRCWDGPVIPGTDPIPDSVGNQNSWLARVTPGTLGTRILELSHRYSNTHPVGLQMQQPPRGETWVGITCDISRSNVTQVLPGGWLHISLHFQNF